MCCNIPKMAAAPLDRQALREQEKTEYSHSHKKEMYLIKSSTKEYLCCSIRFNSF